MLTKEQIKQLNQELGIETNLKNNKVEKKVDTDEIRRIMGVKVEPKKEEKKDGFFKSVAKSIIKPFAEVGVGLYNVGAQTKEIAKSLATGDKQVKNEMRSRDLPFIGETKPFLTGKEKTGEGLKKIVGTGLEIGSNLPFGAGAVGATKLGLSGLLKQGVKTGAKEGLIGGTLFGAGEALTENKSAAETATSALTGAGLGLAGGAIFGGGLALVGKGANTLYNKRLVEKTRNAKTVDDLINKIDEVHSEFKVGQNKNAADLKNVGELLSKVKKEAPKVSLREKWAGIDPAIKKRIAGKREKLETYFKIAESRNFDDGVPTPYGYAGNRVKAVRDKLEGILNDKGSNIGQFRDKIKTVSIGVDDVSKVFDVFDNELEKLNLIVKNGKVIQPKGLVKKTSLSEIKTLQGLRDNLKVLRENPIVENVIDNRITFDNEINFKKSAKEVSGIVDPISRRVRSALAEINRNTIGKEQSKLLEDYTVLRQALDDLNRYANSKTAGSEYLMRLVFSGRGEQSRGLLNTVAKYTGEDLMDDAIMAKIATELLGNAEQQNLFRQELVKAGLDIQNLLGKNKLGTLLTLGSKLYKTVDTPKKMFLKAAGQKRKLGDVLKKKGTENSAGALAGVEVEKDEQGKIKGVKFNPGKAVFGLAGLSVAKNFGDNIGASVKQAKASGQSFDEFLKKQGELINRNNKEIKVVERLFDTTPAIKRSAIKFQTDDIFEVIENIEPKINDIGYYKYEQLGLGETGGEFQFKNKFGEELNVYLNTDGKNVYATFDKEAMTSGGMLHTGDIYALPELNPKTRSQLKAKWDKVAEKADDLNKVIGSVNGKPYKLSDVSDKNGYVYHQTSSDNLNGISKKGLIAHTGISGRGVYFSPEIGSSATVNAAGEGLIFRVKVNKLWTPESNRFDAFPGEESVYFGNVPKELLEYSKDGGKTWLKIKD